MTCTSCGAALHPSGEFCRVCGADVSRIATSTSPRISGVARLRSFRLPAIGAWFRGGANVRMPSIAMPRVGRATILAGVAVLVVLAALLLRFGIADADETAMRDARIANLEAALVANERAQTAMHASLNTAQQDNATLTGARDASQKQVTALEARVRAIEASLKDAQTLTTKQKQDLKTLSSCLNGTTVGLAFGRTGRWSAADLALASVVDACKAAEPLLRQ